MGQRPRLEPIAAAASFKNQAYAALKHAILSMDVYRSRDEIRLDERKLAQEFGISRTPVREALAQLEREGFVRSVPRRGVYVVRKTKQEVIELITAWAALESMAARLITQQASADDIAPLRRMFATFEDGKVRAHLDEYSEVNIEFHQSIIRMSGNSVLIALAENLFAHMRMMSWCAATRSASPSTWRNTRIISTDIRARIPGRVTCPHRSRRSTPTPPREQSRS
jgi:DNA-binding GntR family transcriptional regulator